MQHAAVVYSYSYRDFLYCGAFLLLPIGYCFYLLEIGYLGWRMKMDGRFFLLVLTSLLASADLRILWSFCFYDNPLRDPMPFASLRKSFHTCCKGMRSFYLSIPLLLLYFSPMITMIYLRLYSY